MWFIYGTILLLGFSTSSADVLTPKQFALRASTEMLKHQSEFIQWFYGGAIVLDGLSRIDEVFDLDHSAILDKFLDQYINDPNAIGYQVLHNIPVPWFHNVGDLTGLFPINYLNRVIKKSGMPGYSNKTDITIVARIVEQYILKYIHRLGDGTLVRNYGWTSEPNGTNTFLWCDDAYMGLTLVARAAHYWRSNRLAQFAANQMESFMRYLQDPADGLLTHGANAASQHRSCCKWGRANGWALMAQIEVLTALQSLPDLHTSLIYRQLQAYLQWHIEGIVRYQSLTDGRWFQVVNESSTFLETSATAMFVSGLSRAALHGWVSPNLVYPTLQRGWQGLNRIISDNGTILGVCNGLNIKNSLSDYQTCETGYLGSSNGGLGTVLYAASDYHSFLQLLQRPLPHTDTDGSTNKLSNIQAIPMEGQKQGRLL